LWCLNRDHRIRIDMRHDAQIEGMANLFVFMAALAGTMGGDERVAPVMRLRPAAEIQTIAAIGDAEEIVEALRRGRGRDGEGAAAPGPARCEEELSGTDHRRMATSS